jgi:DNA replication protein DnaC
MSNSKDKQLLTALLKELHLPTVREYYEECSRMAENEGLSYELFLLDLIEREVEVRRENRKNRYLKSSRLNLEKSLDSFDMKRLTPKLSLKVKTLLEGHFLDNAENVLVFGNPGSGKTHLLSAIGIELIHLGRSVYFSTCGMLIQDLLLSKQELKLSKYLKKLSKYDAVIIDDIGYVQQSQEEMEILFTFFSERYEKGSIMISSNLPFSKWDTIFKNPMTAAAAIDRLIHHSIILELNIPSYRVEKAKSNNDN